MISGVIVRGADERINSLKRRYSMFGTTHSANRAPLGHRNGGRSTIAL